MQVLISTCSPQGIARVAAMELPVVEGVEYLVMWQKHEGAQVPKQLERRADVRIIRSERIGLSANRNDLLDATTDKAVLIADDDLRYTAASLSAVRDVINDNPGVDYFSFRHSGPAHKAYPASECSLRHLPKGFYQTSFEVALRRSPRTAGLRYREDFGVGAPYYGCGEEELLLLQARKASLNCRFFPITVAEHPAPSTGNRHADRRTLHGHGAVIAMLHPWSWPLRLPLKALRLARAGHASFTAALWPLIAGAVRIRLHPRKQSEDSKSKCKTLM